MHMLILVSLSFLVQMIFVKFVDGFLKISVADVIFGFAENFEEWCIAPRWSSSKVTYCEGFVRAAGNLKDLS